VVIQQVENNLFVPKIQGDAVELHPTIVMVALVLGGAIGGLLGAILALPIAAASRDVFRYAFHRVDRPPSSPEEAMAIVRANPMIVEKPVGDPTEPPIAPERAPKPPPAPEPPADDSPPEAFENDRT